MGLYPGLGLSVCRMVDLTASWDGARELARRGLLLVKGWEIPTVEEWGCCDVSGFGSLRGDGGGGGEGGLVSDNDCG